MTQPAVPVVGSPDAPAQAAGGLEAARNLSGPRPHVLDLWGKLPDRAGGPYHPLAHHLTDVAASAEALWQHGLPAATRALLCAQMQADDATAGRWLALLAGLHDLGKATPGFQGQDSAQRQRLRARGWVLPPGAARAHDALGLTILHDLLRTHAPSLDAAAALELATVIASHHGLPATPRPALNAERHLGNAAWATARAQLFALLLELAGLQTAPMPPGLTQPSALLLSLLGGLVRVADWTASRQGAAPWSGDPAGYAETARWRAAAAVAHVDRAAGTAATSGDGSASFTELFGFAPNAMQRCVDRCAAPVTTPAIAIIEAPTGTGKTEAALHLAHRWLARGGHTGLYVALPTQATAMALHARLRRYAAFGDGRPGHGRARCGAALLLGRVGVGTVDQALLGVLSDRQAWVRLLGLANKVVILDEVHAYDAYTSRLLGQLLEWLAPLGCSVIVLSASLLTVQRAELLRAYGAPAELPEVTYPRVTVATATGGTVARLPVGRQRRIGLHHLRDDELVGELLARLADGGCAAVICNTIGAAQAMCSRLRRSARRAGLGLSLVHARLPHAWREARERRLVCRFGPGGRRPDRAVVVATQVAEQSLDVDFDLIVTELAPADILVQRLGRLHRHDRPRPAGLRTPEAWLLTPASAAEGLPDFGASGAVYDEFTLLRTWRLLRERGELVLPRDTAGLVESCYAPAAVDDATGPLAARLHAAAAQLAARRNAQDCAARWRVAGPPHGLGLPAVDPASSRWDDLPALRVVCLQREGDHWRLPGAATRVDGPPTAEVATALARHVLTLRGQAVVRGLLRQPRPEGWCDHAALRGLTPLLLDEGLSAYVDGVCLRLDRDLGLIVG